MWDKLPSVYARKWGAESDVVKRDRQTGGDTHAKGRPLFGRAMRNHHRAAGVPDRPLPTLKDHSIAPFVAKRKGEQIGR
ncbi:MAG: hypothetical protein ACTHMG_09195, partial [Sphingomonas sp.]